VPTFHCYRLRNVVDGTPVASFDAFVDFEDREVEQYPEIVGPDFEAKLFVLPGQPHDPRWLYFLRPQFPSLVVPLSSAPGALLIVRLPGASPDYFAFAFGTTGRYLLRDDAWQRAYGLRTALNVIYPEEDEPEDAAAPARLRGVSTKRRSGSTVRANRQATRGTTLDAFDLDRLRDVLGAADGSPQDPEAWGTRVHGGDAFQFNVPLEFRQLGQLCRRVNQAHGLTVYKRRFPMIDYVQPIGDPDRIAELEQRVVTSLRDGQTDVFDLAPPVIIDWDLIDTFRYHFDGRRRENHPDLSIRDFLHGVRRDGDLDLLDASYLRTKRISALTADGGLAGHWSVWRCLTTEFSLGNDTFVLDEGDFYAVERDYLAQLNDAVAALTNDDLELPPATPALREGAYNERTVAASGGEMILLDRKLVASPERGDRLEVCDILTRNRRLIHVKRHLGSSDLSHLFAQGFNSAELLQESADFCRRTQDRINPLAPNGDYGFFVTHPIATQTFEIVYAIIAPWRDRELADALPFFSKMTLRRIAQQLQSRGYRVSCLRVPIADTGTA
jgi:uncharacterized protein (TIGR04141 family)